MNLSSAENVRPAIDENQSPLGKCHIGEETNVVLSNENTENINENTRHSNSSDIHSTMYYVRLFTRSSAKCIEIRLQSDNHKLEKAWRKTIDALTTLQETPDSLEQLRSAITKVRSNFHDYKVVWMSLVDFLLHIGTSQYFL